MKYLFQALGYIALFILALPFFLAGAIAYVFVGFPLIAGWKFGEELVNRMTGSDSQLWKARVTIGQND